MNSPIPHNLRPVSRAFCGRDTDIEAVLEVLTQERVSHLTGPAGIGKSELCRAVGHKALEKGQFPHGVFYLNMDGAGEAASLMGTLVLAFGLNETRPLEETLAGRKILLIWDQMDEVTTHQAEAVRAFLFERFEGVGDVHHLVVTREPLADTPGHTLSGLPETDAFDAFCAHLPDSVSTTPEPDDKDLAHVLNKLEGNPLAIRLTSTWCRPPRWTHLIEEAFDSCPLADGVTLPHGLRLALTIAFDDLNEESIRLMGLLHGFVGGATPITLSATYGDDWEEAVALLIKTGLCEVAGERHYLHSAVREYAGAAVGNRAEAYREQVSMHLHQMVNECKNMMDEGKLDEALRYMLQEWLNLRAAFSWAVARMKQGSVDVEEDSQLVLHFCLTLFHLFTDRGMISEGLAWMSAGIAAGEEVDRFHEVALARDYAGLLHVRLGHREEAKAEFTAALATFREIGEEFGASSVGYHLGLLQFEDRDLDGARASFEEALPRLRAVKNRAFAAQAATYLGEIQLAQGEADTAYQTLTDAAELYEEGTVGPEIRAGALFTLSRVALITDHDEESPRRLGEALTTGFELPPRIAVSFLPRLMELARVAVERAGSPLRALSDVLEKHVTEFGNAAPNPEFQRDWEMARTLYGMMATLYTCLDPAFGDGDTGPDEVQAARKTLTDTARALDQASGGFLAAEQWVKTRLADA